MVTIKELQEHLGRSWGMGTYSEEFKDCGLEHKNFEHALLHITKASGKLAAMVEAADHKDAPLFPRGKARKYVADLVICAIRMAKMVPGGEINLQEAVLERLEEKKDPPAEPKS